MLKSGILRGTRRGEETILMCTLMALLLLNDCVGFCPYVEMVLCITTMS